MSPVNITITVERQAKRHSVRGSVMFGHPASIDEAAAALAENGFDVVKVREGFIRVLFTWVPHPGNQHFEFFVSDEPPPPSAAPATPLKPEAVA